jgi:hypothetical protein
MNSPHTSLVGIPRGGRVELSADPLQRGLLVTLVSPSGTSFRRKLTWTYRELGNRTYPWRQYQSDR